MPTVEDDGPPDLVDPEGKLGILGKRDAVGGKSTGASAEKAAVDADLADKGLSSRQRVRTDERHQAESDLDAVVTAERFVRTHAVIARPTPAPSMASLADVRKSAVRRQRTVNSGERSGGTFSKRPHQGLWGAGAVTSATDAPTPVAKAELDVGPMHGSAVIH